MAGAVVAGRASLERGSRLRRMRRGRRLSQGELGGGRFSASYVSHLETGRRPFNDEILDFFAGRLGVSAEEIRDGVPPAPTAELAAGAAARQEVQREMAQHRFATAARTAAEAIRRADERGAVADVWSLSMLRARALFEDDRFTEAADAASWCVEHPLAFDRPTLQIEALLLAARSARAAGDVSTALHRAERAIGTTSTVPVPDLRAETEAVRVGCLMELNRTEEAVAVADGLAALVEDVPSAHVRGIAQWIVGNVRLLTGAVEEGMARHGEAARLLNPAVDLATWGRFRKAAATVRLQHGITDGVAELLQEAGSALRIVNSASDLTGLRLAEARLCLLTDDTDRARQLVDYCSGDEEIARSPYSSAELDVLRADLANADGDTAAAAAGYRRAALRYQEVGSLRRSVEMWMRHSELITTEQLDREHLDRAQAEVRPPSLDGARSPS